MPSEPIAKKEKKAKGPDKAKKEKVKAKVKGVKAAAPQDHVKIIHCVWFGAGKPRKDDQAFLKMWAGLSAKEFGWEVILWSDGTKRDWIPEGVTYKNFTAIKEQMSTAMGADEWNQMVEIVKEESTPTKVQKKPKKGTKEATLKIVQDMTMAEGKERRSLGNGANYAAASDIVRVAVLYCFGGFYTDMASYPGGYDGSIATGNTNVSKASLAKKLKTFVKISDCEPSTTTTVLWSAQCEPFLVNNAFLGSSKATNPFYLYFLKSMHNMYNKFVYNPDYKSAAALFKAKAKGNEDFAVDKAALKQRLGSEDGFMIVIKRLASRGMTLYPTGPYLLRCCLFYFFHENKSGKKAPKIPTVAQVCQYVSDMDQVNTRKISGQQMKAIVKKSTKEKRPVCYESQNLNFQKVQRGSWDQEAVKGYFVDVYGKQAKERILWLTIPNEIKVAVVYLRTEVELVLVTKYLNAFFNAHPKDGDEVEDSHFTRQPKEEVRDSTGYGDFLTFCKSHEIESTLNLYNKLFALEPKRHKYKLYMKLLDKILEMFLEDGAKLAVAKEMDQQSEDYKRFKKTVQGVKAIHKKYWKNGKVVSIQDDAE